MTLQQMLKLSTLPGWIWLVPEAEIEATELMHDAWLSIVHDAEKNRWQDVAKIRKAIAEWKKETGIMVFSKTARSRYLKGEVKNALSEFQEVRNRYIEAIRIHGKGSTEAEQLEFQGVRIDKKIKGYEVTIAVLEGRVNKKDLITDEMIERAREYPIKEILEIGPNTRAKCVFHHGEDFNMDIRKNFAHCYVCGESGDTIKVYRAKHESSFREAILALQ